jgi:hypothetical protein
MSHGRTIRLSSFCSLVASLLSICNRLTRSAERDTKTMTRRDEGQRACPPLRDSGFNQTDQLVANPIKDLSR